MGLFGTPQPDIRERQARELVELYDRVSRQDDFEVESAIRFIGAIIEVVDARLKEPMLVAARGLVADEYLIGRRPDFPTLDFRQQSALRSKLKRLELKLEDGGDRVRTLLQNIFASLMVSLPKTQTPSPFTISLMHTVERPGEWISRLYKELFDEQHIDRDILVSMREQMYLNLCFHSDIPPYSDTKRAFKHAVSSDLRPEKLNDVYLSKTPLHALFKTSVPLKFTHEDRFSVPDLTALVGKLVRQNLCVFDLREAVEQFRCLGDECTANLSCQMSQPPRVSRKGVEDGEVVVTEAERIPCRRVRLLHHGSQSVAQEGLDISLLAGLCAQSHEQGLIHG